MLQLSDTFMVWLEEFKRGLMHDLENIPLGKVVLPQSPLLQDLKIFYVNETALKNKLKDMVTIPGMVVGSITGPEYFHEFETGEKSIGFRVRTLRTTPTHESSN